MRLRQRSFCDLKIQKVYLYIVYRDLVFRMTVPFIIEIVSWGVCNLNVISQEIGKITITFLSGRNEVKAKIIL